MYVVFFFNPTLSCPVCQKVDEKQLKPAFATATVDIIYLFSFLGDISMNWMSKGGCHWKVAVNQFITHPTPTPYTHLQKNLTLKPQLPKPQPSHPKLQPLKLGKVILIDFRLSYPPKRLSHSFSRKPLGTT